MMPPSRLDCPLSLETAHMGNPGYDATISFGLPFEPEDSQYGEYRLRDEGFL